MIAKTILRFSRMGLSTYARRMKEAWNQDPTLVHHDWDRYFKSGSDVNTSIKSDQAVEEDDMRGK